MGRFADRLLADDLIAALPNWSAQTPQAVKALVNAVREVLVTPDLPRIVIDNVAEYFYGISDQEHWGPEDFPDVTPPFDSFWVEFARPTRVNSEETGVRVLDYRSPLYEGYLVSTLDPEEAPWHTFSARVRALRHKTRWVMLTTRLYLLDKRATRTFANLDHEVVIAGSGNWVVPVGAEGECLTSEVSCAVRQELGQEYAQDLVSKTADAFDPVLLALSFMHARNVTIVDSEPVPPKLAAAREKAGKRPLVKYQVLDIKPLTRMIHLLAQKNQTDIRQALTMVRGHWKIYTPERPLMGKAVGRFWWAPHLAGSISEGRNYNDYRVFTRSLEV